MYKHVLYLVFLTLFNLILAKVDTGKSAETISVTKTLTKYVCPCDGTSTPGWDQWHSASTSGTQSGWGTWDGYEKTTSEKSTWTTTSSTTSSDTTSVTTSTTSAITTSSATSSDTSASTPSTSTTSQATTSTTTSSTSSSSTTSTSTSTTASSTTSSTTSSSTTSSSTTTTTTSSSSTTSSSTTTSSSSTTFDSCPTGTTYLLKATDIVSPYPDQYARSVASGGRNAVVFDQPSVATAARFILSRGSDGSCRFGDTGTTNIPYVFYNTMESASGFFVFTSTSPNVGTQAHELSCMVSPPSIISCFIQDAPSWNIFRLSNLVSGQLTISDANNADSPVRVVLVPVAG